MQVKLRPRSAPAAAPPGPLAPEALHALCLEAGADDAAAVSLDAAAVGSERAAAEEVLPGARTLVALVCRMSRDDVRSPARSAANLEFHAAGDRVNEVARRVAMRLQALGHRAAHPSATFPQEMDRFPGRAWLIAHKVVAEAAGLGRMGIHRNVIHPRFGSFVLLGSVVTDAVVVGAEPEPLDEDPCFGCKLCIAACPVGALSEEGIDFQACYTHNYREFMSGFTDWAETLAGSADGADYRARVSDAESASMWQSLAFKPGYKAAYCIAVCPAGEEVIGPYLADRREHMRNVVRPLQARSEPLYVLAGSRAESFAARRFPHKPLRRVRNGFPDAVNETLERMAPGGPPEPEATDDTAPPRAAAGEAPR